MCHCRRLPERGFADFFVVFKGTGCLTVSFLLGHFQEAPDFCARPLRPPLPVGRPEPAVGSAPPLLRLQAAGLPARPFWCEPSSLSALAHHATPGPGLSSVLCRPRRLLTKPLPLCPGLVSSLLPIPTPNVTSGHSHPVHPVESA